MDYINIFISAGAVVNETHEKFISALESRLRSENIIPNTVGRNTFSADAPLKTISELMDDCCGTIIVALERTYFPSGIEKRGGPKEKIITETKYTTPWNQIEAAMAYVKGHPILVIMDEELKSEGLLEKGYDWYVMSVRPDIAVLTSIEFNGRISSWKKKVEKYKLDKSQKTEQQKKLDTTSLTIGDLIKGLKPASLWAIIIALAGLAGAGFSIGRYWAANALPRQATSNESATSLEYSTGTGLLNDPILNLKSSELIERGVNKAKQGDLDSAIILYNYAIQKDSSNPYPYNLKGYAMYLKGQYNDGLKTLQKSISINDKYSWAHYNIALVYWKLHDEDNAVNEVKTVISLNPEFKARIRLDKQFNDFKKNAAFTELMK